MKAKRKFIEIFHLLQKRIGRRLKKTVQLIYLTTANSFTNNIFESANSCSFGFIFSFIPITLIIISLLIGLLQVRPSILNYVINYIKPLASVIDLNYLVDQVLKIRSFSYVEFLLGIWVIWMARKLFASVLGAISKIFKSVTGGKTLINQLFSFAIEFILVIIIVMVMLFIFSINRLMEQPEILEFFEEAPFNMLRKISSNASMVVYLVIFLVTAIVYKICSHIKLKAGVCSFYAALATIAFYIVSTIISLFFNPANYNMIYGAISSLLLLMMRVWFFFNIFLFFAQMLFCSTYLDTLSFALLYMLPEEENLSKWGKFKRSLFKKPAVIQHKYAVKKFKYGETIYTIGDQADCVYYILKGIVYRYSEDNSISVLKAGSFFGEMHCVLNQPRTNTTIAQSDCEITIIESEDFLDMLKKDNRASSKAISKVSRYTEELYYNEI
ncbi:MAG: YihY/virulence factor BrkB family protein [Treponema sp.]|nr:YihY/virulence factor BrkB family protein [Treponema sp.]